jgi:hypothetical protein
VAQWLRRLNHMQMSVGRMPAARMDGRRRRSSYKQTMPAAVCEVALKSPMALHAHMFSCHSLPPLRACTSSQFLDGTWIHIRHHRDFKYVSASQADNHISRGNVHPLLKSREIAHHGMRTHSDGSIPGRRRPPSSFCIWQRYLAAKNI